MDITKVSENGPFTSYIIRSVRHGIEVWAAVVMRGRLLIARAEYMSAQFATSWAMKTTSSLSLLAA